jgi:predicted MFS family arabinose efflux permease
MSDRLAMRAPTEALYLPPNFDPYKMLHDAAAATRVSGDAVAVRQCLDKAFEGRAVPRIFLVFLPFAAGYFLSYFFRTINALISEPLIQEFELNATQLGFLTSAFFLSAVVQLPLGVLIDRYGPRRAQTLLLLVTAAGAALFATATGFWTLLVGRTLIGIGAGAAVICGFKALVIWFPRARLALMNGCYVMIGALGAVSATAPADVLIGSLGWPCLFEILAAATALCAVITYFAVPEAPHDAGPTAMKLSAVFGDRRFWGVAPLSTMCIGTAWALQGLWAERWLRDVDGLESAPIVDSLFGMALALSAGSLILGLSASAVARWKIRAGDVLCAAAILFVIAELALVFDLGISSHPLWAVIASLGGASVLTYAIIAGYFPAELIGQANAALSTCHIAGAFLLQYAIGFMIDFWGSQGGHYPAVAYRSALALLVLLQIAALAWFAVCNHAFALPGRAAFLPQAARRGSDV